MIKTFITLFAILIFQLQSFELFAQSDSTNVTVHFDHVAISVTDLEESERFYRDVIGLEQIPEPFGVGRHAWFSLGHGELHVILASEERVERDKHEHISFRVDDLDTFIERISAHGIEYSDFAGNPGEMNVRPDGVRQIYFTDPDGYWLEINDHFD